MCVRGGEFYLRWGEKAYSGGANERAASVQNVCRHGKNK